MKSLHLFLERLSFRITLIRLVFTMEWEAVHILTVKNSYFSALFKITDSIKKRWKEKRLDIRVYLYLKDLKIVGGHIFKYRNTDISGYSGHSGYETDPCQQEIRIVSRILNYILKK